ncbi:hypothetical protein DSL64_19270 [Dyadobacter luteus]|uniref:Uncharacterized protein n=1 Tax=Dyadobacter luteus TaxID=2259619 RepID=A0A3D8Y8B7_9BACT|nr:hypothetical protein [Dyadobacter luteus]REA58813.1 hypothetical protein DSL64_19270 [Dyadobacter luteus]
MAQRFMYSFVRALSITLLITCLSVGYTPSAIAQNIITKEIYLKKSKEAERKILFGQSILQAIPVLGKPDKIEDYYFEADEKTGKLYHYGKSHVFFMDDKLSGFTIVDSSLVVGLDNGLEVRVGDGLKSDNFKNYKARYSPGTSFNIYATCSIELNIGTSDDSIFLLFDEKDRLNGIAHWSPI